MKKFWKYVAVIFYMILFAVAIHVRLNEENRQKTLTLVVLEDLNEELIPRERNQ